MGHIAWVPPRTFRPEQAIQGVQSAPHNLLKSIGVPPYAGTHI